MARKPGLETEGGVYHVINRGNYRADIFEPTKHGEHFHVLGEGCQKPVRQVCAWCVMSSHCHHGGQPVVGRNDADEQPARHKPQSQCPATNSGCFAAKIRSTTNPMV
jgi:hypothetical protein